MRNLWHFFPQNQLDGCNSRSFGKFPKMPFANTPVQVIYTLAINLGTAWKNAQTPAGGHTAVKIKKNPNASKKFYIFKRPEL